ncbi:MAG: hypothetical protein Ct9H90mP2_01370 [Dehalococcoidia bacterium]|nr:MAG: hypothetical protein Ct9H90mP2_01370 [Dehalococcoidia bacterium]
MGPGDMSMSMKIRRKPGDKTVDPRIKEASIRVKMHAIKMELSSLKAEILKK